MTRLLWVMLSFLFILGFHRTSDIQYVTLEQGILNETIQEVDINVIQGIKKVVDVKPSILKKTYKYYLPESNIPLDSIIISQNNGEWECVEDAFLEIEGGKKYSVHSDNEDRVYVMFTFDWKNYLPVSDEEKVSITYLLSEGTKGLVNEPLLLNRFHDAVYDAAGQDVRSRIRVTNLNKTFGAYDSVNLTLAKANARNYIKTMDRYITLADYDAVLKRSLTLLRLLRDWQTNAILVPVSNKVKSWVVTTDGVNVSSVQLENLEKKLMAKGIATTDVEIVSANYVSIPVHESSTKRVRQLQTNYG